MGFLKINNLNWFKVNWSESNCYYLFGDYYVLYIIFCGLFYLIFVIFCKEENMIIWKLRKWGLVMFVFLFKEVKLKR